MASSCIAPCNISGRQGGGRPWELAPRGGAEVGFRSGLEYSCPPPAPQAIFFFFGGGGGGGGDFFGGTCAASFTGRLCCWLLALGAPGSRSSATARGPRRQRQAPRQAW
jgi:hypothetical protein